MTDYNNNQRRGDLNWKDKQIEIIAKIQRFNPDGTVYVLQKAGYGANCSFKASEDRKLANLDQGQEIKFKGTIVGIERRQSAYGSFIVAVLNNCIVVE